MELGARAQFDRGATIKIPWLVRDRKSRWAHLFVGGAATLILYQITNRVHIFEPRVLPYRYLLLKSRELPSFNPSNPRTAMLRRVWSAMPTSFARALSGPLMRYLP